MSFATVIGLGILLAGVALFAKLWTDHCHARRRIELDNFIKEHEDALCKAIDSQPGNLAEHKRLRLELCRLRRERDAL